MLMTKTLQTPFKLILPVKPVEARLQVGCRRTWCVTDQEMHELLSLCETHSKAVQYLSLTISIFV